MGGGQEGETQSQCRRREEAFSQSASHRGQLIASPAWSGYIPCLPRALLRSRQWIPEKVVPGSGAGRGGRDTGEGGGGKGNRTPDTVFRSFASTHSLRDGMAFFSGEPGNAREKSHFFEEQKVLFLLGQIVPIFVASPHVLATPIVACIWLPVARKCMGPSLSFNQRLVTEGN